jgi:hypothetical protein
MEQAVPSNTTRWETLRFESTGLRSYAASSFGWHRKRKFRRLATASFHPNYSENRFPIGREAGRRLLLDDLEGHHEGLFRFSVQLRARGRDLRPPYRLELASCSQASRGWLSGRLPVRGTKPPRVRPGRVVGRGALLDVLERRARQLRPQRPPFPQPDQARTTLRGNRAT